MSFVNAQSDYITFVCFQILFVQGSYLFIFIFLGKINENNHSFLALNFFKKIIKMQFILLVTNCFDVIIYS